MTRTIHMNLTEHPTDVVPSDMGYSIGRWEGDTLVIDSARFSAGVLTFRNVHTDAMTLTERLRVLPESGDLEI
ncbi:MAG: hypothetical protein GWN29_09915, partial [Gammaproteobacteria bacterium]|nr:hypothetical protein [Gammaproteobacteria bacterium]